MDTSISKETIDEHDALTVLDVAESLLREGITRLVSPEIDAEQRELLRVYQRELLVITDFQNMLRTIVVELNKHSHKNPQDMDALLDIELQAKSHIKELLTWIEQNQKEEQPYVGNG